MDLKPQDCPLAADRHGAATSLNWKHASWQGVPLKKRRQALLMSWVLEMQHCDAELRGNAVMQQCEAPR